MKHRHLHCFLISICALVIVTLVAIFVDHHDYSVGILIGALVMQVGWALAIVLMEKENIIAALRKKQETANNE